MKLLASLASPYTRKVRVVLAEKKIDFDMELVDVAPAENPVNAHNALGKIPTLVLDDGTALYDSRVIVEFLDHASPLNRLIPADFRDRVQVRRWEALADGVLDAGILVRNGFQVEKRSREYAAPWLASRRTWKARLGAMANAIRSPTSLWDAASAGSASANPAMSLAGPISGAGAAPPEAPRARRLRPIPLRIKENRDSPIFLH